MFVDVNECTENSDKCDVKAVCRNTQGSYTCECIKGYSGNGRNCRGLIYRDSLQVFHKMKLLNIF